MPENLFSPSWYRVATLKPGLRKHSQIHRHHYRGELWYVLQDHVTGKFYRFTPVAYHIIGLMDGSRTVQQLWEEASESFGDEAPTQGDMVRLLSQLYSADVLLCDVSPDTLELFKRGRKVEKSKMWANLRSPLFLRIPLLDPEKFLSRTIKYIQPFFTVYGFIIWLGAIITAIILAGLHWGELTENVFDRVLSAGNLLILWGVYPLIKVVHELAHGYAVKKWEGEVHEMGIMLLVLMPIPYVDASSASAFRKKRQRVVVGSAGILAELLLAALAMIIWVSVTPGIVSSIAYNVVLIGSVSTLLFNGNPLLRYDGYYILADALGIPNLAQRGLNYLGFLFKHYLLGLKEVERPYTGPGEKFWLVAYAILSFIYRLFVYVGIILFVASKFFIIGVLLAIWGGISMFILPIVKKINFLFFSPMLRDKRFRVTAVTSAIVFFVLFFLVLLPMPNRTRAEGVIWVPEDSLVRAGSSGFVKKVRTRSNMSVNKGTVLIECSDPQLETEVKKLRARLIEFEHRYHQSFSKDHVQAKIIKEEIENIRSVLTRAEERLQDLDIRSPGEGLFVLPVEEDLPDRFLRQGELVGYLLLKHGTTVRVVANQKNVDLIRKKTMGVQLRLAERISDIYFGEIIREVPSGKEQLPSTVLGKGGGGEIAIDPFDSGGTKAFEKMFQFDVKLSQPLDTVFVGGRVYVLFDHGLMPIGFQWYRSIRQLFLKRFNV